MVCIVVSANVAYTALWRVEAALDHVFGILAEQSLPTCGFDYAGRHWFATTTPLVYSFI